MKRPWQLWVVTVGGAGLLPKMPGTYGSAVTAVAIAALFRFTGPQQSVLIAGLLVSGVGCVGLGDWAQRYFGRKDPGPVVVDEAAGICLTLLFQPHYGWLAIGLGFAAFRVFDITKLAPARRLERIPAGWGILLDDLAAAVYANLLCQAILRLGSI